MPSTAPTPARWWHLADNNKVVCTLCPRECHIPTGSRGFCFVRANVEGHLELTTYGRSSGFCIDPIEKKPLNHFLPGTPTLSFGTAGCNLGCKFCQNWDISKSREVDTLAHTATPEAIVEAALNTGCRSLAFTYNDPVIWAEYALDIAKVAHQRGLKTVAVTAGYINPAAREEFYQHMDAANVDLKAFTDVFYNKLCQVKLAPILDTLKYLKRETNVWFEITNLMIPGENDSTDETKAMCDWIVENLGPDVPLHFTAFHPDFKMRETPPTPPATLVRPREIALAAGIRYPFVGNVNDPANQSTYCHACHKLLIERDWYKLGQYHMRGNACGHCGAIIPGLFDDAGPGTWGNKRQPIAIGEPANRLINLTTPATPPALKPAVCDGAGRTTLTPQIDFTPEQESQLLSFTREIIASTLRSELFTKARLPELLAQAPAFGMFVSLHRGKQLRSCKGQWGAGPSGELTTLGQMLALVARDAVANDPRFPRIALAELPHLTVEVSLMHNPQPITAKADDRIRSVTVGTHGLYLAHPHGRGLLLPHVATENNWDALTFLEQLCHKAGLPQNAWRDDHANLMTFCARKLTDEAPTPELDLNEVGRDGLSQILQFINQLLAGNPNPEIPNLPSLHQVHPEDLGLCLQTASGITAAAIAPNNSLLTLAKSAAQNLANSLAQRGASEPVQRMTLLSQPQPLAAVDYPARHQYLGNCAVLAQTEGRWSLTVPQPDRPADSIAQVLAAMKITHQQWLADRPGRLRLTAFNAFHCLNQSPPSRTPDPGSRTPTLRPPFRAGTFYPADPAQVAAQIDAFLHRAGLGQTPAKTARAIMLPHAGWLFCGNTLAKTLANVALPKTIIIVGPKHTTLGPSCSIANHTAWQIPGATIPLATALIQRLARNVPLLQCEPDAHREEHAVEVLLPFLHRLRPDLEIVPIVLGQCTPETLNALAAELASIRADAAAQGEEPPLLVISSDMNHYAPEPENRRLDKLALDALQTGNPRLLFETCIKHNITMCGVIPAVAILQALQLETPSFHPRLIDYTTSATASGDSSRVVGYAGVIID